MVENENSMNFILVEEHPAGELVEHDLEDEVEQDDDAEDDDGDVLVVDQVGGNLVAHAEEADEGSEQAGLHDEEEQESQFRCCFADFCGFLARLSEHGLQLQHDEACRLREAYDGHDEAENQDGADDVVAGNVVGYGVTRHALLSAFDFGVIVGLPLEERSASEFLENHVGHRLRHGMSGQVERVGLRAPVDGVGLEVSLNSRVQLCRCGIFGQLAHHLRSRKSGSAVFRGRRS